MKKWLWRWGPAAAVMIAIFAFSSLPGAEVPRLGVYDMLLKKGGHMLGYAFLGAAYLHGLTAGGHALAWKHTALAVFWALCYAAGDEFHQTFTPDRHPAALDVLIDTLGAGCGALALRWLRTSTKNRPALCGRSERTATFLSNQKRL